MSFAKIRNCCLVPLAAVLLTGALASCDEAPTASREIAPAAGAAASAPAQEPGVMFGPHRFLRASGQPVAESVGVGANLSAFEGPFVLHVQNGAPDGSSRVGPTDLDRVSSARVWLDGTLVFGPERFSQKVDSLVAEVQIHEGSVLTVENAGAPGSYLEIRVRGTPVGGSGEGEVGDQGGVVQLKGVASFEFPAGFFPTTRRVTVAQEQDDSAMARFIELESLFRVATRTSSVVRLLAGTDPPADAEFTTVLTVPASLAVPAGHRPELFVQVHEGGEMEVLDNFQLIPSVYDPVNRTLTTTLPSWVFTNARRADGQHEALFMIGTTPGVDLSGGTLDVFADPSMDVGASAAAQCKAGFIGRPVPDNIPAGSPYGVRTDPFNGKKTMHWGTDYRAPSGTPVLAASDGRVERIPTNASGYGLYLILRHTDGSATLYAHLQSATVGVGTQVKRGDPIARSGNSGARTTGPHLHFEYVPNGEIVRNKNRIDPTPCIQDRTVSGSITVRDNGNLADDAFAVYLDNILIGRTAIGASNSFAINNLIPGSHTLRITGIVVPDNVGTYEIILASGLTFAGGGTRTSGTIPAGGSASFGIVVPNATTQSAAGTAEMQMQPNEVHEVEPAPAEEPSPGEETLTP